METIFLESGQDLQAQLKRLQLRKKRAWYNRLTRKNWFVLGVILALLSCGCLAAAVVLASNYISIGGL